MYPRILFVAVLFLGRMPSWSEEIPPWNRLILEKIGEMPSAGVYAKYRKDLPESRRFDELHATVGELDEALSVGIDGRLKVNPAAATPHSFCSSATFLLFCAVIADLQEQGIVPADRKLSRELVDVGKREAVIAGELDGVGIFGHWNADGPGTAVLFERTGIGTNFMDLASARPGDFLKIFWNDGIGKGERGHLVVFLGANEEGTALRVWSSNMENENGTSGYGFMWVETSRIERMLFSRLDSPENLPSWLEFTEQEKTSEYLVRIRQTGSTEAEMREVVRATR